MKKINKIGNDLYKLVKFPYMENNFDSLNEYQELSKLLAKINECVDKCNYIIDNIDVEVILKLIDEMKLDIATFKESVNEQIANFETATNTKIESLRTELLNKIDEINNALNTKIETLQNQVNQNYTEVTGSINSLNTRVSKLEQNPVVPSDLVDRVSTVEADLDSLEKYVYIPSQSRITFTNEVNNYSYTEDNYSYTIDKIVPFFNLFFNKNHAIVSGTIKITNPTKTNIYNWIPLFFENDNINIYSEIFSGNANVFDNEGKFVGISPVTFRKEKNIGFGIPQECFDTGKTYTIVVELQAQSLPVADENGGF